MNYYKLNHGVYPGTTHVYFNCTGEEVINNVKRKVNKGFLSDEIVNFLKEKKNGGSTCESGHTFVIYIPKFIHDAESYSILNHELLHVNFFLFDYIGIKPDVDNHEAFTYFYDYLTEQLYSKTFKEDFTKTK